MNKNFSDYELNVANKKCMICGKNLYYNQNSKDWQCPDYPNCRFSIYYGDYIAISKKVYPNLKP